MARDKNQLKTYRERRDLQRSPEPKGAKPQKKSRSQLFVIHKHESRQLHYDFRIAHEGVLRSWAVPKGPSLNPHEKRLAVPTDDHPMEYARFEGVISKGAYGAGVVMVWDKGSYRNIKIKNDKVVPLKDCFKEGKIELFLKGEKVYGGFALIRTGDARENRWLLIKMRDEYASAKKKPVNTKNKSVKTGRTIYQIEQDAKQKTKKKKR